MTKSLSNKKKNTKKNKLKLHYKQLNQTKVLFYSFTFLVAIRFNVLRQKKRSYKFKNKTKNKKKRFPIKAWKKSLLK